MLGERLWRWYDRAARLDFGGTMLSWIFDWKGWIAGLFAGGGGGMTFVWAAIEGRSPLDVWIVATIISAALAVLVYFLIASSEKFRAASRGAARPGPRTDTQEPRALARNLDDLYAEGVNHRNLLIPSVPGFDWGGHHDVLKEWDDRVLAHLDSDHVPVGSLSSFRTLNRFNPVYVEAPGKSDSQCKMESIWTEKLRRLQAIIDRLG
jgi:hypothetical protein